MIAISYRREDSLPIAGRLYDRLQAEFGKRNVFMDFDSIPPGVDFRERIKETIEKSDLVVALIGPHWLGEQSDGSRRIDDPTDFVRLEIEYALKAGIPVIPLLINTTPMPKPEKLPRDIELLAFRNALPLDSGLDFHQHLDRVIAGARGFIDKGAQAHQRSSRSAALSLIVIALLILLAVALANRDKFRSNSTNAASNLSGRLPNVASTESLEQAERDYSQALDAVGETRPGVVDKTAVELMRRSAAARLPEAQARLAMWMAEGYAGVEKNPKIATELVNRSLNSGLLERAEAGKVTAQETLGNIYFKGLGVPKDEAKAVEWFQRAADQGYAVAEYQLARCSQFGFGCPENIQKAVELVTKASHQGFADAEEDLANKYYFGDIDIPQDLAKAQELYQKAANQGLPFSQNRLRDMAKYAAERAAQDAQKLADSNPENYTTTASGLRYKIIRRGNGATPGPKDIVTVNYRGRLNGWEFDSSYKRGRPDKFSVNGVIKGLSEGLQLMRAGGEYELYIPPQLAYGLFPAWGATPPDSTLVFEVELLDVTRQ